MFRSSGRFFWIAGYSITGLFLARIAHSRRKTTYIFIVCIGIILQITEVKIKMYPPTVSLSQNLDLFFEKLIKKPSFIKLHYQTPYPNYEIVMHAAENKIPVTEIATGQGVHPRRADLPPTLFNATELGGIIITDTWKDILSLTLSPREFFKVDTHYIVTPLQFVDKTVNRFSLFDDIEFPQVKDKILFGFTDNESEYNYTYYVVNGFTAPATEDFSWTIGDSATLYFDVAYMKGSDIKCIVDLFPLQGYTQKTEVFVNGTKIDEWYISKAEQKEMILPASLSCDGKFIITYTFPDATTPQQLNINNDTRKLALGFRSIFFEKF